MKLGLKHSYEIFQLGPDATPDQIKQVYRDLVKKWHPDRFGHDPQLQRKAQEKFIEINEAYTLLRSLSPDESRLSDNRKASPQPPRAPIPGTPRRPTTSRVMRFQSTQESNRFGRIQATSALTIILVAVFAIGTIIYAKLSMPSVLQPSTPYEKDAKLKISWQKLEALKYLDQAKELYKNGKLDEAVFECERGLRLDSENADLLNLRFEIKQAQLNETPNKITPPEKSGGQ